ncbi:MAG: YqzL family protein [Clostridia bacterium]|nr:YqzL family protein [Clostridia bacterium]
MGVSDALWSIFKNTGYIGAYLLYKDYKRLENEDKEVENGENERDELMIE